MNVSDEPGRGKKQCACKKYVGVRCAVCPACGHIFPAKETVTLKSQSVEKIGQQKPAVELEHKEPIQHVRGLVRVTTPVGKCPVKLAGHDQSSVRDWANRLETYGLEHGRSYATSALVYWLREFCDIHGEEYKQLREIVENLELVGIDEE